MISTMKMGNEKESEIPVDTIEKRESGMFLDEKIKIQIGDLVK